MIENHRDSEDSYWHHVSMIFTQTKGLWDGYNRAAPQDKQLAFEDILGLSIYSEYDDIDSYLNITVIRASSVARADRSHCSALVKLLETFEDLYVGHTTWTSYKFMLRMYKRYDIPLRFYLTII